MTASSPLVPLCLIALLVSSGSAIAAPELTTTPAVELRFTTEAGTFYRLEQSDDGESWKAAGTPIKGDGKNYTVTRATPNPKTRFRLRTLRKQWVQVWHDEFDGTALDTSKWAREENSYGGGNNERQFYSTDPKYSSVRNGTLRLAVFRDPHTTNDGKTQPYSSARIRTLHRAEWKYGKFEIRAKVPGGEGIWPAIWMLPTESNYGTWAASGEIDIVESHGSKVGETTSALHFGGTWPDNRFLNMDYKFPDRNGAEAFHTYTLEWERDEIRWFVDGVLYHTRRKEEWSSDAAPDSATAPYDQPFHLILNVAVDGHFFNGTAQRADNLPPGAFPQVLEVDYIRVSQWAE